MGLKKILGTFLMLSCFVAPALAANWVQIGEGHYIDAQSIKRTSEYGTFTFNTKYLGTSRPLEIINNQEVWTVKTYSFMDCRNAYAKTLNYTAYNASERIVDQDKNVGKQWFGINTPGSRGFESYAYICTDKYIHSYPGYRSLWWY